MIPRRDWMRLSAAGVLGASASGWLETLADAAAPPARPKACILLWMNGGPAQGLTFDVKEGGPYRPAATAVPGLRLSEHLPRLGKLAKHLAVLRGMSTGVSSHGTAHHLMGTGFRAGAMKRPALGSVVSLLNGDPASPLPGFAVVDGGQAGGLGVLKPPFAPAYAGPRHAPMMVDDPAKGLADLKPASPDFAARSAELEEDNAAFLGGRPGGAGLGHATAVRRALGLMGGDAFRALDLGREPAGTRERYGSHRFGQACLLARRLVQAGVSFVEVVNDGWDDHGGAIDKIKGRTWMDQGFAALLEDLAERGLLGSTLVVWMGEFGRTPSLNHGGHHCKAWTTVLAGAGVKGGQAVGATDEVGDVVTERPIDAPTFMATVLHALGIDPRRKLDANGFAVPVVDQKATPLSELF